MRPIDNVPKHLQTTAAQNATVNNCLDQILENAFDTPSAGTETRGDWRQLKRTIDTFLEVDLILDR